MIFHLHSHYSIDYVMGLRVKSIVKLLTKAIERNNENKAWQLYLTKYPQMDEKSYIPFEEFYKPKKQVDEKPVKEILNEVKETLLKNKGSWVA